MYSDGGLNPFVVKCTETKPLDKRWLRYMILAYTTYPHHVVEHRQTERRYW
jgi:hypothetical protein